MKSTKAVSQSRFFVATVGDRGRTPGVYALTVASGMALAAGQLFLIPHFMAPREFGLTILGIAVTQGSLTMSDLGLNYVNADVALTLRRRAHVREAALLMSWLVNLSAAGLVGVLFAFGVSTELLEVVLGGLFTGLALESCKLRGASYEAAGNARRGLLESFLWQNSPKLGILVGVIVGLSPAGAVALGGVAAVALTRPLLPLLHQELVVLAFSLRTEWLLGLASVVGVYFTTWGDTYAIAGTLGIAQAANYEAYYRVMASSTYLVIPLGSMLTAAMNARLSHPLKATLTRTVSVVTTYLLLVTAILQLFHAELLPGLHLPLSVILILALGFVASAVSYVLGQALVNLGSIKAVLRVNVTVGGLAITCYAALTPTLGLTSAALTFCLAAVAASLAQAASWRSRVSRPSK